MDSVEFTKIAAGVLVALLTIFGSKVFIHEMTRQKAPEKPGIVIATADSTGESGSSEEKKEGPSFMALLASADAAAGEKVAKKCKSCHTFNEGGKNGTGPALWGLVNRAVAGVDGFKYTNALKEKADQRWTFENLDAFLANPQGWAKGTGMRLAVKKDKQRADLVAYLNSLSKQPAPLPSGS